MSRKPSTPDPTSGPARSTSANTPVADALHDLAVLIRSRYGLVHIQSPDERRASSLLRHLADGLELPLFRWNRSTGLRRDGAQGSVYGTEPAMGALGHIGSSRFPALYHFEGLGPDLENATFVALLKELATAYETMPGALVLTGSLELPEAVRGIGAVLTLPAPTPAEYKQLVAQIYRDLSSRMPLRSEITSEDLTRLVNNLKGLTLLEAEKILTKAMVEDGKLGTDDIRAVIDAKKEIVEREGVLEYFPVEQSMQDIADLAGLKQWLRERRQIILDPERAADFGLEFPKGMLLLGVPGCGKSLCAKAVAHEWSLPLLKLDPSRLYNKYIGESERNFERAIRAASQMAPVILWIDELEKAFSSSGGDQDGGTSQRIFGTFLSWMQERRDPVFVVATANDVHRLPAEFLRKGRFDEVFFVDLPDAETRHAIVSIHLRRRKQDPALFDLERISKASSDFSGAELEQVIVAALFKVFSAGRALGTTDVLEEIAVTQPLAHTMSEKIAALRQWASTRVRSAH